MARAAKKADPELLLVSFCDIVTVSTCALFMAMLIIIYQALMTPVLRPTPLAEATTNAPVYFECRAGEVFPVDRSAFADLMRGAGQEHGMDETSAGAKLQELSERDMGNEFYRIRNSYLMIGILALSPRPEAHGVDYPGLLISSNSFQVALQRARRESQYFLFLVRDDSFKIFRMARDLAYTAGFQTAWEYLGKDEPIVFEGSTGRVRIQ